MEANKKAELEARDAKKLKIKKEEEQRKLALKDKEEREKREKKKAEHLQKSLGTLGTSTSTTALSSGKSAEDQSRDRTSARSTAAILDPHSIGAMKTPKPLDSKAVLLPFKDPERISELNKTLGCGLNSGAIA